MKDSIVGKIVAKQTAKIPQSQKEYGFVLIEDLENEEQFRLKVDANTDYEVLERGAPVSVKMEILAGTDILRAIEISKN
jgi:hypothetical protein